MHGIMALIVGGLELILVFVGHHDETIHLDKGILQLRVGNIIRIVHTRQISYCFPQN